jgi:hypothetical protein
MQRVRAEVLQPYGTIRMQTTQMSNLHRTTDMLRHVLHRLKLVAKLKVAIPQLEYTSDEAPLENVAELARPPNKTVSTH